MAFCGYLEVGFLGDARKTLENKGKTARENLRENRPARLFSPVEPVATTGIGQNVNGQSHRAWRISSWGQGKCPIYIGGCGRPVTERQGRQGGRVGQTLGCV